MLRLNFLVDAMAFISNSALPKATSVLQVTDALAALERKTEARIGLAVLNPVGTVIITYRGNEPFPLASTQKLPLVMAVLARHDLHLSQDVRFAKTELDSPDYSSISEHYPNGGTLRLTEICARTISQSDNTGADVLARLVGGPKAVTAYLRSIHVTDIRIDRMERQLPERADAREPRDTGTPKAMAQLVWRLAYHSPLPAMPTQKLLHWMRMTTTGDRRIRAGVPKGWQVADKTGSYDNAANDVGLIYPPDAPPVSIACYVYGVKSTDVGSNIIASVVKAVRSLI